MGETLIVVITETGQYLFNVLVVGAVTETGSVASFSNDGDCVDVYAPGTNILGADAVGGMVVRSGTSNVSVCKNNWLATVQIKGTRSGA